MASQIIGVTIHDDLCAQTECSFRPLLGDRLYPACHPDLLALPAERRNILHGKREMGWSHRQIQGGADVGQRSVGLNSSDPGLLLETVTRDLDTALVSQLLAAPA